MTQNLENFQQSSLLFNPKIKAGVALAVALFVYSSAPVLIRLGEAQVGPIAIIFHRFCIATLLLSAWNGLLAFRQKQSNSQLDFQLNSPSDSAQFYTNRTLSLLIGSGVCFALGQVIWAFSLAHTSVANSSLLHSFAPIFAVIEGSLLFAQKFDRRFLIGMMITVLGAIVLGFDDFLYDPAKVQGDVIALIAAAFFAMYFLLLEQIREQFEATTVTLYCFMIGTVTVIPFLFMTSEAIFPSSLQGCLVVLGLAWTMLLIYLLTTYALKWLSSGLITVVLMVEPALSAVLAWFTFGEALDFWNLCAFPIIFMGIYLATTSSSAIKEG